MGINAALTGLGELCRTIPGVNHVEVHQGRLPPAGSDTGVEVAMGEPAVVFNPGQIGTYQATLIARFTAPGKDPRFGESTLADLCDRLAVIEDTAAGNTLNGNAEDSEWVSVSGIARDDANVEAMLVIRATLRKGE